MMWPRPSKEFSEVARLQALSTRLARSHCTIFGVPASVQLSWASRQSPLTLAPNRA
jgi:hypothetical protein